MEFWRDEINNRMFAKGDYNIDGEAPKGSTARNYYLDPQRLIMLLCDG